MTDYNINNILIINIGVREIGILMLISGGKMNLEY